MSGAGGRPTIVGVVNVTPDSFSDGGRYLDPAAACAHARALARAGAGVVELGPAASSPDAAPVAAAEEIRRLEAVLPALVAGGLAVAVDSFQPGTQAWAARQGAAYVNDVRGFPDPAARAALAPHPCRLVVMHSVAPAGIATRARTETRAVVAGVYRFFAARLRELEAAGIARERLIVDPGMGFFLGADPGPSLAMLRRLGHLRATFGLPVLVSVSRKSFLGAITGRAVADRGAATLAAELWAAAAGADYIRTHDVAALRDALAVQAALSRPDDGEAPE